MSFFKQNTKKGFNYYNKPYKKASALSNSRYYEQNNSKYYNVRLSRNDMKFVYDALKSIENIDIEEYCVALDNGNDRKMQYMDQSIKSNRAIRARMAKQLINKKQFSAKK